MDLKAKIVNLVVDMKAGNVEAERELDAVLSQAYDIDYFKLFLIGLSKKDCMKTIKRLFTDSDSIGDLELSTALSSLLTHSLIELKKDTTRYFDLNIPYQSTQLNDFLLGTTTRESIREFFYKYL